MSGINLSSLLDLGRVKVVDYTTSGTFLPADYGLRAGDVVWLRMVGGGAGGACYTTSPFAARGGDAGGYLDWVPCVIGDPAVPIPVTVGSGGTGNTNGLTTNAGSASSFGGIVASGGPGGGVVATGYAVSGRGAGGPGMMLTSAANASMPGGPGVNGFARGGSTNDPAGVYTPRANSGDGGGGGSSATYVTAGASGRVQVFIGV